jgi:hypothetical protein
MRCPALLTVLLLSALSACAHASGLEDGVLHKGDVSVRFGPVPAGWTRIAVRGADLSYRDDANEGSVLFDVRCNARDNDAPLASLTEHLIMGTTAREVQREETIPFDGREAQHTLMTAKLDGVAMQYDLYVMKKDGCVYDVVYVAPPDRFAAASPAFERFAIAVHGTSGP